MIQKTTQNNMIQNTKIKKEPVTAITKANYVPIHHYISYRDISPNANKKMQVTVILQNEARGKSPNPTSVHQVVIPFPWEGAEEMGMRDQYGVSPEDWVFAQTNSPYAKGPMPWDRTRFRSLSVGDLVIYANKTMRCDSNGWTDINSGKHRESPRTIQCKIWKLEEDVEDLLMNDYNESGLDLVQIKTAKIKMLKEALNLIQDSE